MRLYMKVAVESINEYERRITIQVPAGRIEREISSRLQNRDDNVFPPDSQPNTISPEFAQHKNDAQIRQEVLDEIILSTLKEALTQENLSPIGTPIIEAENSKSEEYLEYRAIFKVQPDIDLKLIDSVTIEKPVACVEENDVTSMLNQLRLQRSTWVKIEGAAEKGHQIIIDFEGMINGKPFSENKGVATSIVLGSGTMVGDFENQLIGATAGNHYTLNLKFPGDYFNEDVAGKEVTYEVHVQSVSILHSPGLDDDFAKTLGVEEGLEVLRKNLKSTMEIELSQAIQNKVKKQVFDALIEANNLTPPKHLVEEMLVKIKPQASASESDEKTTLDINLPDSLFEDQARKQAILSLLIPEIIRKYSIQTDTIQVQEKLKKLAHSYEDPDQVIRNYQNDPSLMKSIEELVLEECIVECLIRQANVKEIHKSFNDIMKV